MTMPISTPGGKQWPAPPEVSTRINAAWQWEQILGRDEHGEFYPRYIACAAGCGWLIGVGDAVDTITHASCERASASSSAHVRRMESNAAYMRSILMPREPDGRFTPIGTVQSFDFTVPHEDVLGGPWVALDGGTVEIGIVRQRPPDWRYVLRAICTPSRWQHLPTIVRAWRAPPVEDPFDAFIDTITGPGTTRSMEITTVARRLGDDSVWADDFDPYRDIDPPINRFHRWAFPSITTAPRIDSDALAAAHSIDEILAATDIPPTT